LEADLNYVSGHSLSNQEHSANLMILSSKALIGGSDGACASDFSYSPRNLAAPFRAALTILMVYRELKFDPEPPDTTDQALSFFQPGAAVGCGLQCTEIIGRTCGAAAVSSSLGNDAERDEVAVAIRRGTHELSLRQQMIRLMYTVSGAL
jgi:hypothetical protein